MANRSEILDFTLETESPSPESEAPDGERSVLTGFEADGRLCCAMVIIGQIEGHFALPAGIKTTKYEHVIPRLVQVEQDPAVGGLLLILNTVGGDIEAGLAISELIAGMTKPTVSLVLGGGHSIGIPLAVSAKRSFIAKTATMTVHPVRMNGTVLGVPQTMAYFREVQERIVDFVCENSRIAARRFRSLMTAPGKMVGDMGTVLRGEEAVKEGLIDGVGTLADAVAALRRMFGEPQTK